MSELIHYDSARRELEAACRIDEVKSIRDKATAMQEYARQAKDGQLIEWATDIRLRAERKAGQLLTEMAETGERAGRGHPVNSNAPLPLKDLGASKIQFHRWQKLGRLDDDVFEARVAAAKKQAGAAIDLAKMTNEEKRRAAADRTSNVEFAAAKLGKFAVIYADPPWRYENASIGPRGAIENHYPTMTLAEICALPIADIAHENAVILLWTTAPKLYECMKVIDAWGFVYRTGMVWVKGKIGMGYYVRNRHEHLLICKRGELPMHPPESARCDSAVEAPRLEHSAKPEIFYDIIDAMYPGLRKIELFSRSARPGWSAWGNQVQAAA